MREQIVAGNWKMHGNLEDVCARLEHLSSYKNKSDGTKVVVFPSQVYLAKTQEKLLDSSVEWGAQTVSEHPEGAFTGEISCEMLLDFSCKWVIIGHSERRQYFNESSDMLAAKIDRCLENGLRPIYCVGETRDEYEAKKTHSVIEEQISAVLSKVANVKLLPRLVVAYEPVWAIGTGLTATPEYANDVHGLIRERLSGIDGLEGDDTPILYGGSVKPDNAAELFAMPHIDGGLVGGASLDAKKFLEIVECIK